MSQKQKAILAMVAAFSALLCAVLACVVFSSWSYSRSLAAKAPPALVSASLPLSPTLQVEAALLTAKPVPPTATPAPLVYLLPTLTALFQTTQGTEASEELPQMEPASLATHTPGATPTSLSGMSNVYVEFILDASDKMNATLEDGRTKGEVASRLLSQSLMNYRPETNVGLRVFGHRLPWNQNRSTSCQDIELVAPLAPGYQGEIVSWLQGYTPRGMSPLADALTQAVMDFVQAPERLNAIVLISAGSDSCSGDPCMVANIFQSFGVNLQVHVIGFGADDPSREQLVCTAEKWKGSYYDTQNDKDLIRVLDFVRQEVESGDGKGSSPMLPLTSTPNERERRHRRISTRSP